MPDVEQQVRRPTLADSSCIMKAPHTCCPVHHATDLQPLRGRVLGEVGGPGTGLLPLLLPRCRIGVLLRWRVPLSVDMPLESEVHQRCGPYRG